MPPPTFKQRRSKTALTARENRVPSASDEKQDAQSTSDEKETAYDETLRDHRTRQKSIAGILDNTFGRFADCATELWDRRAYLMLVGMVYERLAAGEQKIPTDELMSLAKVLADGRRAQVQADKIDHAYDAQDKSRDDAIELAGPPPASAKPHDDVTTAVRQVYGTDLPCPLPSKEMVR